MKHLARLLTFTIHSSFFILHFSFFIFAFSLQAETYTLRGQRYLRKYTAAAPSQVYNAEADAQTVVRELCNVPWTLSRELSAKSTSHAEAQLDANVADRESFDAALFCSHHVSGTHVAHANAAVYRYRLPSGTLPKLLSARMTVTSDPYNSNGARIVLLANSSGVIPTDCATVRGDVAGGVKAESVARRQTRTQGGKDYWYPTTTNLTLSAGSEIPAGGLQLAEYLYVFVLLENYSTTRGNWLEGCSYIDNSVTITTDAPVPGWADGSTRDLTASSLGDSPDEWVPFFATTNTVFEAVRGGESAWFAAPTSAYRSLHYGSTNASLATHLVTPVGEDFLRGAAATNTAGFSVTKVLPDRRVIIYGHDVLLARGFESYPPVRGSVMSDSDGDGIPDGWEVYVGSDPFDPSDATSDWDGDGLSLAQEYDHGHWPTDPRSADTDRDGVLDRFAFAYHLKGCDAAKDFDGDGLPNYAEYLVSEVFGPCRLSPDHACTSDGIPDFHRKFGDFYIGEIFTGMSQTDRKTDSDLDGWSDFSESLALTDPKSYASHPQPAIDADVRCYAHVTNEFVVLSWCEESDPDMTGMPDAKFLFSVGRGLRPVSGHVREGRNTFVCYMGDANGGYRPGSPFGVVRGVDVGWAGAKFSVELTETSAITPRIDLWDAASRSDRATTIDDSAGVMVGDPSLDAYPTLQAALADRLDTRKPLAADQSARIRVVRYAIDDRFCHSAGVYDANGGQLVVMDKTFNPAGRNYLCEADFIGDNQFDIDWGTLAGYDFTAGAIVAMNGSPLGTDSTGPKGLGLSVSNMTYLVVLGEGTKDFFGTADSNSVRTVTSLVTRRFEVTRHRPVVASTSPTVYSARPTFTWSIPDEEAYACKFGSSYTAFRLKILAANGSTVVYDSGVRRAPAQDKNGNFVWEAPVCAGQKMANGQVFSAVGNWTWRVAMFNAKFMPNADDELEVWSNTGSFSTAVNAQQAVNDHGYSSVDVAVKYAGSTNVLAKGVVRVQAFADASFSGDPLAETAVTNDVADLAKTLPNAKLVGLAVPGTYFVRAYIDMNPANGMKDAWESWGYAKSSVTFAKSDVTRPVVGLYIEDVDTDGDLLPDAWEIARSGSLKTEGVAIDPDGKIVIRKGDYDALTNGVASISTGLNGATLTFFENLRTASVVLGLSSEDRKTVTIDDIRSAINQNIDENAR